MAKVQIIIPVINNLSYTKEAIASIKTSVSYRVVVIDQESSDGTKEWCDANNISCYRFSPRLSLSGAWNFGIREALKDSECDYILVVNNDILFHEKTIDNLMNALDRTGYAMVTGSNVAPYLNSAQELVNYKCDDSPDFDFKPITNWREEGPDFSCFMINMKTIEDIGYFDENFVPAFYEDNDYHNRIKLAGGFARRITRAPYYHFGSVTARSSGVTSNRAGNIFYFKWNATPEECMDGKGWKHPYNEGDKDWRYWYGCDKYTVNTR